MNIAEILKNAPKGTKLYSPLCGEVTFSEIDENLTHCIVVEDCYGTEILFDIEGKYDTAYEDSECLLFPSKDNRDWSTFKVEPKFPTNIDGCWNINGLEHLNELVAKLDKLRKLIIARDAWWKVDNDWKPNWADSDTDKWVIECYYEDIRVDAYTNTNFILTFRTKEICNKFFDTFRDLIEDCKELI